SMRTYTDAVFAPLDADHVLERVAGGNETEVYRSDSGRLAVKLKAESGGSLSTALAHARELRAAAEAFADCLGPRYSIPSHFLLARDSQGRVQALVVQPYLAHARPLAHLDYRAMSPHERRALARALRDIIARARSAYWRTGAMPDLYGRVSLGPEERQRNRSLSRLPQRLWSFLVRRTLLRSYNLLWTGDTERPVVLVDYDPVRRSRLYRRIYYAVRQVLFLRDQLVIGLVLR
ncbi:MAG: hypothetical protein N2378_01165, partial [Chloroflexaceae bacterium]|nr:hypothetical protein [Chloroflexaceae bacterium]